MKRRTKLIASFVLIAVISVGFWTVFLEGRLGGDRDTGQLIYYCNRRDGYSWDWDTHSCVKDPLVIPLPPITPDVMTTTPHAPDSVPEFSEFLTTKLVLFGLAVVLSLIIHRVQRRSKT